MSIKGKEGINMKKNKAKEYVNDKDKASELLDEAKEKLKGNNSGPIEKVWSDLQLLFKALNDWIKGNYREFPTGTLIMIIASLLYFVSPIDLVPDFIPVAGLADDATVITFTIRQIHDDLQKYKVWKKNYA